MHCDFHLFLGTNINIEIYIGSFLFFFISDIEIKASIPFLCFLDFLRKEVKEATLLDIFLLIYV